MEVRGSLEVLKELRAGRETTVQVVDTFNVECFKATVVDLRWVSAPNIAILIVPIGREREYIFDTPIGRKELTENSGFDRVAFVTISMVLVNGFDEVQEKLVCLAQAVGVGSVVSFVIPGDSGVGTRDTIWNDNGIVVEEVYDNNNRKLRRLRFDSRPGLIQSEAYIDSGCSLTGGYQIAVVAATCFLPKLKTCLIIGLGGGSMATFLKEMGVLVTVIEIDSVVLEVAQRFFGLELDDELTVHIDDGIEFIQHNESMHSVDCVIIDVDSKDLGNGMSCPPMPFVEESFLERIKSRWITPGGSIMINVASRNRELTDEVISKVQVVFGKSEELGVPGYINSLVIASTVNLIAVEKRLEPVRKIDQEVFDGASEMLAPFLLAQSKKVQSRTRKNKRKGKKKQVPMGRK